MSDQAAPERVGSLFLGGEAIDLALDGDTLYVADAVQGLHVVDVTSPTAPELVGTHTLNDAARVAVSGDHAYVGADTGTLYAIDVSTPASPVEADNLTLVFGQEVYALVVAGSHVYVGQDGGRISAVSISDPETLATAGTFDAAYDPYSLAISGSYAFAGVGTYGLEIVDISDLSSMSQHSLTSTVSLLGGTVEGIVLDGNRAYLASESVTMVDIADLSAPEVTAQATLPGNGRPLVVSGNYAYVGLNTYGIATVRIDDTSSPLFAGNTSDSDARRLTSVEAAGSYAYGVSAIYRRLTVVDTSTAGSPAVEGAKTFTFAPYDVAVSGSYAYVANSYDGLAVVDVSTKSAPSSAGSLDTDGNAFGVAVDGNYAYLADDDNGLVVADISTPSSPSLATTVAFSDQTAYGVEVSGDYAYVALGGDGLAIVDIETPSSAAHVATYSATSQIRHMAVSGSLRTLAMA